MPFWTDEVVPRVTDKMLGTRDVMKLRHVAVDGLHGDVVEIGFGSGLNVPLYPARSRPSTPSTRHWSVASSPPSASPRRRCRVEFVGLDGEDLPLDDASVDAALSTFTLCTIPDVARAVREVHRVLRPGGTFHFLEHGLCPDPGVARWQHRLQRDAATPRRRVHLDRPIDGWCATPGSTSPTSPRPARRPVVHASVGLPLRGRGTKAS